MFHVRKYILYISAKSDMLYTTMLDEVNGVGIISYKKLWKLLIDKDMVRRDLREACGLSTASMSKLTKGQNINTDILVRICDELHCDISDICEIIHDKNQNGEKENG